MRSDRRGYSYGSLSEAKAPPLLPKATSPDGREGSSNRFTAGRRAAAAVGAALVFSLLVAGGYQQDKASHTSQLHSAAETDAVALDGAGGAPSALPSLVEEAEIAASTAGIVTTGVKADLGPRTGDRVPEGIEPGGVGPMKVHTAMADWGIDVPKVLKTQGNINVVASNEYGSFSREGLALYAFAMVIEPYRYTTLTAVCDGSPCEGDVRWFFTQADGEVPDTTATPVLDVVAGASVRVLLEDPKTFFFVRVEVAAPSNAMDEQTKEAVAAGRTLARAEDGSDNEEDSADTWYWQSARVACKYVRRELRLLTPDDRERYFSALEATYRMSTAEGQEVYGSNFISQAEVAAMHNSGAWCYHNGMQFLTSHVAFNILVERALQSVDPSVALHYWDFMVEAGTLGAEWQKSPIFSESYFGSAMGSLSSDFQILNGHFSGVRQAYDPEYELVSTVFNTQHNAFGFVNALTNAQTVPFVTRTYSFCGLQGNASFVGCDVFIACFENKQTLADWTSCVERSLHMNMHGLLGGAWDCAADFDEWHADHPAVSTGLLTFVLEYIASNRWGGDSYWGFADNNVCPSADSCVGVDPDDVRHGGADWTGLTNLMASGGRAAGDTPTVKNGGLPAASASSEDSCTCTCEVDVDDLTDTEIYDLLADLMASMQTQNASFIGDNAAGEYVWLSDGKPLSDADNAALMRAAFATGCTPGQVGLMATGASPMDPIFWTLHPIYEKALHPLRLSRRWQKQYSYDWVDGACYGSGATDAMPFTASSLGFGSDTRRLLNTELFELADPTAEGLPYVYDGFDKWGTCQYILT